MKRTARLASLGGLALATTGLLAAPATAAPSSGPASQPPVQHSSAAVFVQTDGLTGNSVLAYQRATDGSLRLAGSYPTGGVGGALTGSVVDHLASQGSLNYDRTRGLLYAVNAGSNTITVFAVRGDRLVRRQVISSGGNFPVSVAVRGNTVYVLNARGGGSVQGYLRIGDQLVLVPAWQRSLGLDASQTPEFTHTPGQLAFTPDGSKLIVTTKANGSDIDVYQVNRSGGLSGTAVVNADPGAVPFGIAFDRQGRLAIAEAGSNSVATFSVRPDGTLRLVSRAATGQAATCWIVGTGAELYLSNAGSASVSGYRSNHDATLSALGNTATGAGTVDAAATPDGRQLYVQGGAAGTLSEFAVNHDGSLTPIGSVLVPGAVGGEGIAAS